MVYKSKKEFLEAFDKAFDDNITINANINTLNTDYEMVVELTIVPIVEVEFQNYHGKITGMTTHQQGPGLVDMMYLTGGIYNL